MRKLFLIATFLMFYYVSAQSAELKKQTIMECLIILQHEYDNWLDTHPDSLNAEHGIQSREGMGMYFSNPGKIVEPNVFSGLEIWFSFIPEEAENRPHNHIWPLLNIAMDWNWRLPGKFTSKRQEEFMRCLKKAIEPMNALQDLEAKRLFKDPGKLLDEETAPFLITCEQDSTYGYIQVRITPKHKSFSLYLHPESILIFEDSARNKNIPKYCFSVNRVSVSKIPFSTYKSDSTYNLLQYGTNFWAPGTYTFRVVVQSSFNQWLDVTPTYVDGQPITRKVENAWTGLVISAPFSFEVPVKKEHKE